MCPQPVFQTYVLFIWMSHQLRCENCNQHIQTLVEIGNFLPVQWWFSESIWVLSWPRAQVQYLVRELRSCKPCDHSKKEKLVEIIYFLKENTALWIQLFTYDLKLCYFVLVIIRWYIQKYSFMMFIDKWYTKIKARKF